MGAAGDSREFRALYFFTALRGDGVSGTALMAGAAAGIKEVVATGVRVEEEEGAKGGGGRGCTSSNPSATIEPCGVWERGCSST